MLNDTEELQCRADRRDFPQSLETQSVNDPAYMKYLGSNTCGGIEIYVISAHRSDVSVDASLETFRANLVSMNIDIAVLVFQSALLNCWNDAGRPLFLRNVLLSAEFVLELP